MTPSEPTPTPPPVPSASPAEDPRVEVVRQVLAGPDSDPLDSIYTAEDVVAALDRHTTAGPADERAREVTGWAVARLPRVSCADEVGQPCDGCQEEADAILAAIAHAGGRVVFDQEGDGEVRAEGDPAAVCGQQFVYGCEEHGEMCPEPDDDTHSPLLSATCEAPQGHTGNHYGHPTPPPAEPPEPWVCVDDEGQPVLMVRATIDKHCFVAGHRVPAPLPSADTPKDPEEET